jgi:predicted ribosomally synthesized peptide with SipW-like signal peptide
MPKLKAMLSLVVIVLAVALIGGATMAWFTAATDPLVNEFEAGTVKIDAGWKEGIGKIITKNWNPGDSTDFEVCVENIGSKKIRLRAQFNGRWVPGSQRMLVLYKNDKVQLLSMKWDSFCKGCTGTEGPIAYGQINIKHPGTNSYWNGRFISFDGTSSADIERFIKNADWIITNDTYQVWCVDKAITISQGNHDMYIYDPTCNPNWHDEVDTQSNWDQIPWYKLDYIINNYSHNIDGFTKDDMQDAIWSFTNPGDDKYFIDKDNNGLQIEISEKAKEIVDDVYANADLDPGNVDFELNSDWFYNDDDGWWYYKGEIDGTFTTTDNIPDRVCFPIKLKLDGASTGNDYQAASYHLFTVFEAIQASNQASDDQWQMSFDGNDWSQIPPASGQ